MIDILIIFNNVEYFERSYYNQYGLYSAIKNEFYYRIGFTLNLNLKIITSYIMKTVGLIKNFSYYKI